MRIYAIGYFEGDTYKVKRVKANTVAEAHKKANLDTPVVRIQREEYKDTNMAIEALEERPKGEWTLLTEERPVDDYEIIATAYWPEYGDSAIAVGHIDRFDKWHLYSPTEGELIKGFEVIAWMPLPEPYCGADMRGEDE